MSRFRTSAFFSAILLACANGHATGKAHIRWGEPVEDKPAKDNVGVVSSRSNDVKLSKMFMLALPDYNHTFFEGNVQRVLGEMDKTPNTCSTVVFKTPERTKIAYFTPVGLMPPPRIVTRASLAKAWVGSASSISLKALLKKTKVHGETGVRRSFGDQIDAIIQSVQNNNLKRNRYDFFPKNVFDMISNGRADYTLEHPYIIERYLKDPRYSDIVFLEIEEATEPLYVHLACSRSPLGLQVVEQADKWIREKIRTPELKDRVARLYEGGSSLMKLPPVALERFISARAKKVMIE